eukprot:564530-Amphidinium_carterae.1
MVRERSAAWAAYGPEMGEAQRRVTQRELPQGKYSELAARMKAWSLALGEGASLKILCWRTLFCSGLGPALSTQSPRLPESRRIFTTDCLGRAASKNPSAVDHLALLMKEALAESATGLEKKSAAEARAFADSLALRLSANEKLDLKDMYAKAKTVWASLASKDLQGRKSGSAAEFTQ